MSYRIEIWIDDDKSEEIGPISLASDDKWQENVTFLATKAGQDQKVEFILYRGGETEPYLDLHLWLDVEEAG